MTFDDIKKKTATSAVNGAGVVSQGTVGSSNPLDFHGNTDYSALFNQKMNEGADYDTLNQIAAARAMKTATDGRYSQYQGDATQQAMEAYLARIKPQEKPTYQGYTSQADLWNNGGYSQVLDAQKQALDAYVQQAVASLNSQKTGVSQSADQAAQEAYLSYMMGKKNMPQAMAAAGYSGGMADSQALALESGYQGNLKDILLNRDNAINDIDTAINKAKLEGSIQAAQAQAELGRDAISAWQSYLAQQNAFANSDFWTKYGYDFQGGQGQLDRDFQATQAQLGRDFQADQTQKGYDYQLGESARDRTWNLILNGIMPDATMLAEAGITEGAAQGYVNAIKQKAAASGGSGTGTVKPTLTAAQTLEALKNGIVNETTLAAYRSYFGEDWKGTEQTDMPQGYDSAYNAIIGQMSAVLESQGYEGTRNWAANYLEDVYEAGGVTDAEFDALQRAILAQLDALNRGKTIRVSGGTSGGGSLRDPAAYIAFQ